MRKYTIMFYGSGGGNVDGMLEFGIEEYLKAMNVGNKDVRFAVQWNMSKTGEAYSDYEKKQLVGEWGKCYRYELTDKTDLTKEGYKKYIYKNASEVPMYKQSTLVEYINWVKKNVPAENYIFVPTDHGGGFDLDHETLTKAIIYDDNHNLKGLSCKTVKAAFQETNTHLKAIVWFGCLMGQIEVLTETAPICDYQFASSHVSRTIMQVVSYLIEGINTYPDDFEKAAKLHKEKLEDIYVQCFQNIPDEKDASILHQENCDFSCWRSNKIAGINAEVKKLASFLVKNYKTDEKDNIDMATHQVYLFEKDNAYADLLDIPYALRKNIKGEAALKEVDELIKSLTKAIDDARITAIVGANRTDAGGVCILPEHHAYSIGISMYSKELDKSYKDYGASYTSSAFNAATQWSRWIDVNQTSVMDGKNLNPCNDSIWELYWLVDPE